MAMTYSPAKATLRGIQGLVINVGGSSLIIYLKDLVFH